MFIKTAQTNRLKETPSIGFGLHAQTIHLCLEIMNALRTNDEKSLKILLDSRRFQAHSPEWITIASGPFIQDRMLLLDEKAKVGLHNQAEVLLVSVINNNLKTVLPKLDLEQGGPQLRFTFSALIEVPYWQLADWRGWRMAETLRSSQLREFVSANGQKANVLPPRDLGKRVCVLVGCGCEHFGMIGQGRKPSKRNRL